MVKKRNNLRKIKKINELQCQYEELNKKIKEQRNNNIKNFSIRNFKIFGSICNFILPYVVTSGILGGVFWFCGGGFPVVRDDKVKRKVYELDYLTDDYIEANEYYKKFNIFSEDYPDDVSLKIYFPWKYENNNYVRIIRNYVIDDNDFLSLYEKLLSNDISYIVNTFSDYDEEIEYLASVDVSSNNYVVEASMKFCDLEDTLNVKEDKISNIVITIVEGLLVILIGTKVVYSRNFSLKDSILDIKEEYDYTSLKPMKLELEKINKKLLSLNRGRK